MAANDHDKGALLPYAARCRQQDRGGRHTPLSAQQGAIGIGDVFCRNCGRAISGPNRGQKFCRKALGQKGSCKDRYWSRGLRRLRELEKEVEYLADLVNKKGWGPPPEDR